MNVRHWIALLALPIAAPRLLAQETPLLAQEVSPKAQQRQNEPIFGASSVETYKKASETELKIFIFNPADHQRSDKRAAIVFFFGGGWKGGNPQQFQQHCRYLASRGMVAMAADYRVHSRQQATVNQCVADAKSAIRWVRANAGRLGVDPDRIAASGGSAGGHLAAAAGTLPDFDEPGEDKSISSRPNVLVLFNPALDLTFDAWSPGFQRLQYPEFQMRWGADPKALSPTHNVRMGTPPTIVFHGTADATVPYAQVEGFAAVMNKAGNRCELVGFDGQAHGFFNFGRGENKYFIATLERTDRFLESLGYLKGNPVVGEFLKSQ